MSHQQGGSDVTNPVHLLDSRARYRKSRPLPKVPMYVAFMVHVLFLSFTTAVRWRDMGTEFP